MCHTLTKSGQSHLESIRLQEADHPSSVVTMEWVNLIDNAVDKLKKDGRDADASEFLDLKAFLDQHPDHLSALMHIIG